MSEGDDDDGGRRRGDAAAVRPKRRRGTIRRIRRVRSRSPGGSASQSTYYWAKSPPKPTPYQPRRFVNGEQRKLYWVMTAFNLAKVAAIVTVFLLMFGRI